MGTLEATESGSPKQPDIEANASEVVQN